MNLGRRAHLHEAALVENGHLVGHHVGKLDVVGHHDGGVGHAPVELGDELRHQPRVGGIEARGGLVEEDHLRLGDQGPRDAHPLAHAPGQLRGQEIVGAGEPHQGEEAVDAIGDLPLAEPGVLPQREGHVLEHGEGVEEGRVLEHVARPPAHGQDLLLAQVVDARAEEIHLAVVGREEAVADAEQHGLARAAAPHHGQGRPLAEGQAQPPQYRLGVEGLPHLPHLDQHLPLACGHHQKRMRRSLVRKKSETITPIATCTTVAVVERPKPSVPPSVARPL